MVGPRKVFKTEVLRWLENAILNLAVENERAVLLVISQCAQKSKFGNKFNNLAQNKPLGLGGGSLEAEVNCL